VVGLGEPGQKLLDARGVGGGGSVVSVSPLSGRLPLTQRFLRKDRQQAMAVLLGVGVLAVFLLVVGGVLVQDVVVVSRAVRRLMPGPPPDSAVHAAAGSPGAVPLLVDLRGGAVSVTGGGAAAAAATTGGASVFNHGSPMRADVTGRARCRNTAQGRALITDDRGYVCTRQMLFSDGCCDEVASELLSCAACNHTVGCCLEFEHCVSCCMQPAHSSLISAVLATTRNPAYLEARDTFDFCRARCRTSSSSIIGENTYRSALKYCYGREGAPLNVSLTNGGVPTAVLHSGTASPLAELAPDHQVGDSPASSAHNANMHPINGERVAPDGSPIFYGAQHSPALPGAPSSRLHPAHHRWLVALYSLALGYLVALLLHS
jgi:SREBP regulating gene protein